MTNCSPNPNPPSRYFGGRLRDQWQARGVTMSEVEYPEARACRPHTHDRAFFAMPIRGGYAEVFRTFRIDYRPFEIGFHPTATHHADEIAAPGASFFIVEMDRTGLEAVTEGKPGPTTVQKCDASIARVALRLLAALRDGTAPDALVADALLADMLGGVLSLPQVERDRPRWVGMVIDMLRADSTKALTLSRIARMVDRHPVYISRAFRHFCGVGLPEYRRRVRVEAALADLADPELPLVEVAFRAGFSDQSAMSRTVRAATGLTPGGIRALSRQRREVQPPE